MHQFESTVLDAIKAEHFGDFCAKILSLIESVQYKNDFNTLIQYLTSVELAAYLDTQEDVSEFAEPLERLREKYYAIILKNNDAGESFHIYLYDLYRRVNIESRPEFSPYIDYLNSHYKSMGDVEKTYIANLLFTILVLNGQTEEGLSKWIRQLVVLHLHHIEYTGLASLAQSFVDDMKIDASLFIESVRPLFEERVYFSLSQDQQRSIYNWCLHIFWNIQSLHSSPLWTNLYPEWKRCLNGHIARDQISMAMYVQFYIYHKMGNNFQTLEQWKDFNRDINLPCSTFYSQWGQKNPIRPNNTRMGNSGKIRIALLKDRVVDNSVFKVEYSLLKMLKSNEEFNQKYELAVYTMNYIEKSNDQENVIRMLHNIDVMVVNPGKLMTLQGFYYDHHEKAMTIRDTIISDQIDVLIASCNNFDILDFILVNRTCPKQIFWSHGNHTYQVDNIDFKITHASHEGYENQFHFFIPPMDDHFLNPKVNTEKAELIRQKWSKDKILLGSIGRLVKVDSDKYLEVVAKILKDNPNTLYLACGPGNEDSLKEKIKNLGIEDQFCFEGFVDPHVYSHVIDIYLNTFPLSSGLSLEEFYAKGKPFISLYGQDYFSNQQTPKEQERIHSVHRDILEDDQYLQECLEYLESIGFDFFMFAVNTPESFVERTSILIKDPKASKSLGYYLKKSAAHAQMRANENTFKTFVGFLD